MSRTLRLYPWYCVLSVEGICHGLYVPWLMRHAHLEASAVAVLLAMGDVLLFLLQIPAGRYADRFGCRRSLLLGSLSQAVGLVLLWRGETAVMAGLGCLVIAVGDAFRCGAQEALLFHAAGEDGFASHLARASRVTLAALAGLTLLGGALASVSFDAAWGLEVMLSLLGLGVAWQLSDAPLSEPCVFRFQLSRPIAAGAVVAAACSVAGFLTAAHLASGRPWICATTVAVLQLVEAWGAGRVRERWLYRAPAICIGCLFLGIPGAVAIFAAQGAVTVARSVVLQREADEGSRATVESAAAAVDMLAKTAALLLAAWLTGTAG